MSDLDEDDRDDIDEAASELDSVDSADGDDDESIEMEEGEELDDVDDVDDETEGELRAVEEELSHRDQNARSLAIRRAIEQRMEQKRLSEDLDYLDLDLED
jgi:hypothetical protein